MTRLHGHAEEVATFLSAAQGGRLHHAWLLAGPQGVGKARFAEMAALRLLAEAAGPPFSAPGLECPEDHRVARLLAAGSHPDFRRLERVAREGGTDLARSISVAQVRSLQSLFATTPSLSNRRVILIDAIDDLERAGANALLKNLEEPPADTLFLLVSHAPGRLLPTIRSRCRLLRFSRLPHAEMEAALRDALPDADAGEVRDLVTAGEGAPGRAVRLAGLNVAAIEEAIGALITRGDPLNRIRVRLARDLSAKSAQPRYEAFLERVPRRVAAHARSLAGPALAHALEVWEKAGALAASAPGLSLDPQATVFELAGMLASLAPAQRGAKP
jgi:DNA polymerase-3 subunit delta'